MIMADGTVSSIRMEGEEGVRGPRNTAKTGIS